jgi:hypothetical protein
MNDDIRYIELIKACGLYGNDHLGDMLELCYQVAADERSKRELVRLTDEEIFKIYMNSGGANIKDCFDFERLICVIEDKLKEKNTCQSK